MIGMKFDGEKPEWHLLNFEDLEEVVEILTFGAKKYAPNNYKLVEDPFNRYFSAAMRHLVAYKKGEQLDPESNRSHLSHCICNLLFLMYFEREKK
jgi:hypothetical protein